MQPEIHRHAMYVVKWSPFYIPAQGMCVGGGGSQWIQRGHKELNGVGIGGQGRDRNTRRGNNHLRPFEKVLWKSMIPENAYS